MQKIIAVSLNNHDQVVFVITVTGLLDVIIYCTSFFLFFLMSYHYVYVSLVLTFEDISYSKAFVLKPPWTPACVSLSRVSAVTRDSAVLPYGTLGRLSFTPESVLLLRWISQSYGIQCRWWNGEWKKKLLFVLFVCLTNKKKHDCYHLIIFHPLNSHCNSTSNNNMTQWH